MKAINTKTTKRVAAIILAALAACSVMGCSVEKNFTVTETHTETDANGNTTTTTTTTTNHNGDVTTETTSTDDEEVNEVMYEKVPVAFTNDMEWDIKDLYIKMSNQDEWSDNFLDEDQYIDHDTTANGITVNYNDEQHFMDVRIADSNGDGEEFTELELPAEGAESIEIVFSYDEAAGTYAATVNAE